jgi:hypothetical protein
MEAFIKRHLLDRLLIAPFIREISLELRLSIAWLNKSGLEVFIA